MSTFGSALGTATLAGLLVTCGARAETSVTLYGIADGNVRFDPASVGALRSSGLADAPGWGLRATESLGHGVTAIADVQQDFDAGDTALRTASYRAQWRRAVVGLRVAGAGTLRLGREYSAFDQSWVGVDAFGGAVARLSGDPARFGPQARTAVTYESPALGGLRATAQFRANDATTNPNLPSALVRPLARAGAGWSASLAYTDGPAYFGVGWLTSTSALDGGATRSGIVSGVYDFKAVQVHALFFQAKGEAASKQSAYSVGLAVPLQAFRVLGVVGRLDSRADDGGAVRTGDANYVGLLGSYGLSKRTDLYAFGTRLASGTGTAPPIGDGTGGTGAIAPGLIPGSSPWSLQLGVRHNF